jgi:nucleotide-binding universal stress UspA family protein
VFASIVVGTDGSETAGQAVQRAIALALELGARLEIVSAYEPRAEEGAGPQPGQTQDRGWTVGPHHDVVALLEQARSAAVGAGLGNVQIHPRQGDAADAIIDVAEEHGAELIVVGNKGRSGARRFLLGSVPNRVSHHAPCSVLIVRTT